MRKNNEKPSFILIQHMDNQKFKKFSVNKFKSSS